MNNSEDKKIVNHFRRFLAKDLRVLDISDPTTCFIEGVLLIPFFWFLLDILIHSIFGYPINMSDAEKGNSAVLHFFPMPISALFLTLFYGIAIDTYTNWKFLGPITGVIHWLQTRRPEKSSAADWHGALPKHLIKSDQPIHMAILRSMYYQEMLQRTRGDIDRAIGESQTAILTLQKFGANEAIPLINELNSQITSFELQRQNVEEKLHNLELETHRLSDVFSEIERAQAAVQSLNIIRRNVALHDTIARRLAEVEVELSSITSSAKAFYELAQDNLITKALPELVEIKQ